MPFMKRLGTSHRTGADARLAPRRARLQSAILRQSLGATWLAFPWTPSALPSLPIAVPQLRAIRSRSAALTRRAGRRPLISTTPPANESNYRELRFGQLGARYLA